MNMQYAAAVLAHEKAYAARSHGVRRAVHGVDDALVARTPAEVARQPLADFVVTGIGIVVQQRGDRHDETGRAEAALQSVAVA